MSIVLQWNPNCLPINNLNNHDNLNNLNNLNLNLKINLLSFLFYTSDFK